jgi:hypothetical protein
MQTAHPCRNHPRRNRSPGALLRLLGLVLGDDHDGVRFTAKRPKPTDVADHHRPRREPKGSSLLLHSFNPGFVLNDRCSMASCLNLHTSGRTLIHITPYGNKSLMTRFYRGSTLYQISKCNLDCRASNSRASISIICRSLHATSRPQQMKRKEPLSVGQASAAKRPRARVEVPRIPPDPVGER